MHAFSEHYLLWAKVALQITCAMLFIGVLPYAEAAL